jgi:hypothetical protein
VIRIGRGVNNIMIWIWATTGKGVHGTGGDGQWPGWSAGHWEVERGEERESRD